MESALFEWQQRQQKADNTITGDILKEKAHQFWGLLPQYRLIDEPKWSNGWLNGFKHRHCIRKFRRFGEGSSVDRASVEIELEELRNTLSAFLLQDIYNIDETGLFWKASPDGTLATERTSGTKVQKSRITANFTCNADGSHKLPIWFIGNAKLPRYFGRAGINISNLDIKWRSNKKA